MHRKTDQRRPASRHAARLSTTSVVLLAAALVRPAWADDTAQPNVGQPDVARPNAGDAAADNAAKPTAPTIAAEPQTIDPASLMPAPLAAVATVEFSGESLLEVAAWFAERHGVTVLFDRRALEDLGLPLGEPVYDRLAGEPLYLLLNRLRGMGLAWYYEDGIVTVTSAETAATRLSTQPFNLGELLDAGYDRDRLSETICATVASDTWATNGGGEAELQWLGDVLFVSQTQAVQQQVAGLLRAIREPARRTFAYDPPQHLTLREKLDQPVTVRLEQTPLVVAVEKLGEAAGVPIRLDTVAIEEAGVREREPITIALEDRSLRVVLTAALRSLGLTWTLRDGVLLITSEEAA
ncbi:MAG: hypothetical protein AAF790_14730, partial [Planctomycetota bacterium]